MNSSLDKYSTIVFDCDGVLLNSNKVKTEAFYRVGLSFGEEKAKKLVDFHVSNGGISRYKKFEYFKDVILDKSDHADVDVMLNEYAQIVYQGLLDCDCAESLDKLRLATEGADWMVVSGGDQEELRRIFKARGIDFLFNAGIFGSPDPKEKILEREFFGRNRCYPALFLGDSRYDRRVSEMYGLDFIFVSDWSECDKTEFVGCKMINKLISLLGD